MKTIINKLFTIRHVKEGVLLPTKKKIQWIPVLPKGDFYMGLDELGEWVVEVKEGIHSLSTQELYVYAMVLLEQPIHDIQNQVLSFFMNNDIEIEIDVNKIFPFVEIIRAGLDQGADYWAELSFKWYYNIPEEKKVQLKNSISNVTNSKWASQKLRQKAKKELRKIERIVEG